MPAIVRIEDLVKNYYMGSVTVYVLKQLNLTFDEGDFIALMGPSGSGKSTLLNVLGCLDRPTSGHYYLGDVDVSEMDDDQLSEVRSTYLGFIFQSYNLLPQYTVVENIELPLLYQGIKLNDRTKDRCVTLAEMVGLGDRLDHRPLQLPGGQRGDRLAGVPRADLPRQRRGVVVEVQPQRQPGGQEPVAAQAPVVPLGAGHHHRHQRGHLADGLRRGEHAGRAGRHQAAGGDEHHRPQRQAAGRLGDLAARVRHHLRDDRAGPQAVQH